MCNFDKDFNNHFKKILDTNILKLLKDLDYELLTLDKEDRKKFSSFISHRYYNCNFINEQNYNTHDIITKEEFNDMLKKQSDKIIKAFKDSPHVKIKEDD